MRQEMLTSFGLLVLAIIVAASFHYSNAPFDAPPVEMLLP